MSAVTEVRRLLDRHNIPEDTKTIVAAIVLVNDVTTDRERKLQERMEILEERIAELERKPAIVNKGSPAGRERANDSKW